MADLLMSSLSFIRKNILDILLVSLGLLILLTYIILNNIQLNQPEQIKKIKEVVVFEPFNNIDIKRMERNRNNVEDLTNSEQSICEKLQGQSHKIEEMCSNISTSKCSYLPCCVLASLNGKEKCVSGDKTGPTYHTDEKGNMFHLDYYYYQNKKY